MLVKVEIAGKDHTTLLAHDGVILDVTSSSLPSPPFCSFLVVFFTMMMGHGSRVKCRFPQASPGQKNYGSVQIAVEQR